MASVSYKQLRGEKISEEADISDCSPVIYNKDLKFRSKSISGEDLDPDAVAHPCGIAAQSVFKDTFTMTKPDGSNVSISAKGIAWEDDLTYRFVVYLPYLLFFLSEMLIPRFKNVDLMTQWADVEDERFVVWMRNSPFPDFRKIWGKIEEDLSPGTYQINVKSQWDISSFDGEKYIVLSQTNSLGGKNLFLGYSYIVVGGISLLCAIGFIIRKISRPKGLLIETLHKKD